MAPVFGQGVAYCRQAREIIMNVWNYFRREDSEESEFTEPRSAVQATLMATGVKARSTLYKIEKEGAASPKKRGPKRQRIMDQTDNFDRGAIRRIITKMYEEKQWPTVSSIYQRVREEIGFHGSHSTFHKLLKKMGYKYAKRPTRNLVKERPDIVAKRHEYLHKIKKIRAVTDCPILYLDETFLHQNHTVGKCWQLDGEGGFKVPTGKGNRLIILHAGSKAGFVPGAALIFQSKTSSDDYHDEMNGDAFVEWFDTQLLPNIPANSCIVMDNASYHSVQEEKIPTMNSKKADMQEWLTANNIAWNSCMIKPQLYELIKIHKPRCIKHVIDELARKHGHYILRLPPYHCELNAVELIWAQIKNEVAKANNTFKMSDIEKLLQTAIENVSQENWEAAEKHVIKLEEELYAAEVRIDATLPEDMLNSFRFYLEDSDNDSDWESDDDYDFSMANES